MPRSLALIHTVTGLIPVFEALMKRHLETWTSFNIVDESLLRNTIRAGELSPATTRRLINYVWSAVDAGADAVFVTCSSLGPAVDLAAPICPVPLVRVDEGMADAALTYGRRIGVLATLPTTLKPTTDLIERRAAAAGGSFSVLAKLCEGAFARLAQGDSEGHDALVADGLRALVGKVDVVVLAQASMARALKGEQGATGRAPILASPELGVIHLRSRLGALGVL